MSRALAIVVALACAEAVAAPREDPTAHLDAERDALLDKIARGVDVAASTRRFAALLEERDRAVPTKKATVEALEGARRKESERHSAALEWERKFRETADWRIRLVCELAPDPSHPPARPGHPIADWGRLTRKKTFVRHPADDNRPADMGELFEVKGVAKTYVFDGGERTRGHSSGDFQRFRGEVGDLVFVCPSAISDHAPELPPGWSGTFVRSGFAARLERPPLIADKKKLAPVFRHPSALLFYETDKERRWPANENTFIQAKIGRDLGNGRVEIASDGHVAHLEVPPKIANRELLVQDHTVWLILGTPRFEPLPPDGKPHGLRPPERLVVPVLDIEGAYLVEKP